MATPGQSQDPGDKRHWAGAAQRPGPSQSPARAVTASEGGSLGARDELLMRVGSGSECRVLSVHVTIHIQCPVATPSWAALTLERDHGHKHWHRLPSFLQARTLSINWRKLISIVSMEKPLTQLYNFKTGYLYHDIIAIIIGLIPSPQTPSSP